MSAVYLGDHVVLAKTMQGRLIYLDSRDVSVTPHVAMGGHWERHVTEWVMSYLSRAPEGIVIDGGANCGWYSLIAKQFERDVLAVDANPRMVDLLNKTFAVNGMLPPQGSSRVVCAALGHEEDAHCFLVHAPDNFGSADVRYDSGDPNKIVAKPTKMRTLDSLVHPSEKVSLIKLDIEGWEPQAIQGARRVLEDNPQVPILFEHNAGNGKMVEEMCLQGYQLALIDKIVKAITPSDLDGLQHGNMLLLRKG